MRTIAAVMAGVLSAALAYGDFKVTPTVDVVTLTDGVTVTGTVIAEGAKGVLIVKDAKEMLIPKDKVAKVEKGRLVPETRGYTTDPVEGKKIVTGEGFRDQQAPAEKSEKAGEQTQRTAKPPEGQGKVTPDMIKAMLKQKPEMDAWVKTVGGPDKAAAILNDPNKRKELEKTAKTLGINLPTK